MDDDRELIRRIEAALPAARAAASRVGSMHANWDVIFDYEALCAGKTIMLAGTKTDQLRAIARMLGA